MSTRTLKTWIVISLAAGCVVWLLHHPAPHFGLILGMVFAGTIVNAVTLERQKPTPLPDEAWNSRPDFPGEHRRRALIVGAGEVGCTLAAALESERGYCVVGFVDDGPEAETAAQWPVLGSRSEVSAIITRYEIEEVVVAYAPTWQQRLVEELMTEHQEIEVRVVPTAYEALMRTGRVENLGDVAVVRLTEPNGRIWDFAKRLLDILVAVFMLTFALPVMLLAALLVKLSSPGPAVFRQERVGRGGKPFILYKYRTMVQDAEARTGPVLSCGKDDARLTKVGRLFRLFRIDELPQFWNVLRGEMSLVGPRPERPNFVAQFERMNSLYALRHEVRPGITGLAQVCGGYKTDPRDKLRFDLIYISHRSIWLDIKILLRTVLVVLSSRGS